MNKLPLLATGLNTTRSHQNLCRTCQRIFPPSGWELKNLSITAGPTSKCWRIIYNSWGLRGSRALTYMHFKLALCDWWPSILLQPREVSRTEIQSLLCIRPLCKLPQVYRENDSLCYLFCPLFCERCHCHSSWISGFICN